VWKILKSEISRNVCQDLLKVFICSTDVKGACLHFLTWVGMSEYSHSFICNKEFV